MRLLAGPFAQQDPLGLPKCARGCMRKAAPSAASRECLSSTFSCLCENHWFTDGYKHCVHRSCGVKDTHDAEIQVQVQCNKLFPRDSVPIQSYPPQFTPAAALTTLAVIGYPTTPAIINNAPTPGYPTTPATITNPTTLAFVTNPTDYAIIAATAPIDTAPIPALPTTLSRTTFFSSPVISKVSFAGALSNDTSSRTSSSSSSSISKISVIAAPSTNTTPPSSSGISQSTKIGAGLGVPFAIVLLALMGYALHRYHRNKQVSRGSHMGHIAAAEPFPSVQNAVSEKGGLVDVGAVNSIHKDSDPVSEGRELHGQHIPPYSRELEGSPGHGRKELPG